MVDKELVCSYNNFRRIIINTSILAILTFVCVFTLTSCSLKKDRIDTAYLLQSEHEQEWIDFFNENREVFEQYAEYIISNKEFRIYSSESRLYFRCKNDSPDTIIAREDFDIIDEKYYPFMELLLPPKTDMLHVYSILCHNNEVQFLLNSDEDFVSIDLIYSHKYYLLDEINESDMFVNFYAAVDDNWFIRYTIQLGSR